MDQYVRWVRPVCMDEPFSPGDRASMETPDGDPVEVYVTLHEELGTLWWVSFEEE